jgi:hypothetical protein
LLACVTEFPEVFCLSDQVIELPTAEMVNAIENSLLRWRALDLMNIYSGRFWE